MLPTLTELIFCPGKQAGKQAIWNTVCVQHKDRPLRLILIHGMLPQLRY